MIDKSKMKNGDSIWYVQELCFEERNEQEEMITHKEFYCLPKIFEENYDYNELYNPERLFTTESEANICAFELSNTEGF